MVLAKAAKLALVAATGGAAAPLLLAGSGGGKSGGGGLLGAAMSGLFSGGGGPVNGDPMGDGTQGPSMPATTGLLNKIMSAQQAQQDYGANFGNRLAATFGIGSAPKSGDPLVDALVGTKNYSLFGNSLAGTLLQAPGRLLF